MIRRLLLSLLVLALAPVAVAQTQTLRLATLAPDGSPWMRELRAAAEQVKAETGGRVEIRYFPGGVMGNDQAVLRRIRQGGQLQGGVLTSSELSLVYPDAPVYTLPFLFSSWAEVDRTSLQTGMVDMVANTPAGTVALQWHGRLKSLYDLPLVYVIGFIVVDQRAWSRIAPADQAAVDRIFKAASARVDQTIRRDDVAALEAMKKQGLTVVTPTPADAEYFRDVGRRVLARLEAEQGISPAVLNAIREAKAADAAPVGGQP